MAIPDPYANEPTTEVDPDLYEQYQKAKIAVKLWTEQLEDLKRKLQDSLGDAHAGTVDGRKVVSYRPQDRYASARIIKDYPDLVTHYFRITAKQEFQVDHFVSQHPDIAEQYRIRAFVELG